MGTLLSSDEKTGSVSWSPVVDLPYLPKGSNQAVAIFNALVRILDAKLLDRNNGHALTLLVDSLHAIVATLDSFNATDATISTAIVNDITATTAEIASETVVSSRIQTLVVINKILTLLIGDLTADTITASQITATIKLITTLVQATNLTATTGTIQTLNATTITTQRLVAQEVVSLATQSLGQLVGSLTLSPLVSTPATVVLPYIPVSMSGKVLCTFNFKNSGASPETGYLHLDIQKAFTTTTPGGVVTVSPRYSLVTPTYFTEASYTTLLPSSPVGKTTKNPLTIQWKSETPVAAIYSNYAGGIDLTAKTGGTAGNSITVEIVVPGSANAVLGITEVGSALTVSLPTDGSSAAIPTRIDTLIALISTSSLVTATLHSGASPSATIATSQTLHTLSGGAAGAVIAREPVKLIVSSDGTQLTISADLMNASGTGLAANGTFTIDSLLIEYFLDISK